MIRKTSNSILSNVCKRENTKAKEIELYFFHIEIKHDKVIN